MTGVVVTTAWLADHREETCVVDTRDAWEYDGIGHVPGAVNVPFDSYRGDDGEMGKLPGADRFAELMSAAGVSNDDRLVAYDDTHGVFAARLLVTAELYGHDPAKLHLLDGDFSAWQRQFETANGGDASGATASEATGETTASETTAYSAAFDTEGPLITIDEVRAAIDAGATLVDTREQWEYEEGHIEGAVRLDWRELVDDETRGLLPEADLRDLLAERDVRPGDRVVLYCNTARRISHTYTVLRHLGFPDLAFYEGSLTQWEREGGELVTE